VGGLFLWEKLHIRPPALSQNQGFPSRCLPIRHFCGRRQVATKHQFGRAAGIEGNLKTEVVDVNMMFVPDVRKARPEASQRAIAAANAMEQRLSCRYLFEEFSIADRQQLDDAVLEMLGIEDSQLRNDIRHRLYQAIEEQYRATRERELIAQRHRRRSQNWEALSAADIAEEIWEEHSASLGLLQFPEDFLRHRSDGESFDLPAGGIEVGTAMLETGRQLRAGTIRVGGPNGSVLEVGSVHKAYFLEALAECGYYGSVRVPGDQECATAYQEFTRYKVALAEQFASLAAQHTRDQRRQRVISDALMRRALSWRNPLTLGIRLGCPLLATWHMTGPTRFLGIRMRL